MKREFEVLPRAWTLLHEAHGAPGASHIPSNREAMEKVSDLFANIETAVQKRLRYEEA
jgi:hypothetical protein